MATIANLLLKNFAAVDVTFAPDTVRTGEYAKYADRSQGSFLGTSFASITRKIQPKSDGVRKIQGKITAPVVDVTTGALMRTNFATVEFVTVNSATQTEKNELYARLVSLVGHAVFGVACKSDEMPWG